MQQRRSHSAQVRFASWPFWVALQENFGSTLCCFHLVIVRGGIDVDALLAKVGVDGTRTPQIFRGMNIPPFKRKVKFCFFGRVVGHGLRYEASLGVSRRVSAAVRGRSEFAISHHDFVDQLLLRGGFKRMRLAV